MAARFDIIFAFKAKFGDEKAARIISELHRHKALWNFISKESNYLRIDEVVGENTDSWSATSILDLLLHPSDEFSEIIRKEDGVTEILERITQVRIQVKDDDWEKVLPKLLSSKISFDGLFTVLTYFAGDENQSSGLMDALIQEGDDGLKVISKMLLSNSLDEKKDFLTKYSNQFISNPEKIQIIADHLKSFGGDEIAIKFTTEYLDLVEQRWKDGKSNWSDQFEGIKHLLQARNLASSIGDRERAITFKKLSEEYFIRAAQDNATKIVGDFSILEKAKSISRAEPKQAVELCRSWLDDVFKMLAEEPGAVFLMGDFERVESVFIQLNLHFEYLRLLELFYSHNDQNAQIGQKIGDFCAVYGEHERVIRFYQPLFGENTLSRNQAILLARAYAYFNDWESAYLVIKSVNTISSEDALFTMLCKQKNALVNDLHKELVEILIDYPDSQSVRYILAVLEEPQSRQLKMIDVPPNEIRLAVEILYHHFSQLNTSSLMEFLAGSKVLSEQSRFYYFKHFSNLLPSSEQNNLVNDLFAVKEYSDQKVFESVLKVLFDRGNFKECEEIITANQLKWQLSREILKIKIALYLEKGRYKEARPYLADLKTHFRIDNDIVKLNGIFALRSTPSYYPYSDGKEPVLEREKADFLEIDSKNSDDNDPIGNQILRIEITSTDKTKDYLALAAKTTGTTETEAWRIPYAIGCHFFHIRQFDHAITYLKESRRAKGKFDPTTKMLVEAYIQLKLYDESVNLIANDVGNGKTIDIDDLKWYADLLYQSDSFIAFLSREQKKEHATSVLDLIKARVYIKRGLESSAKQILIEKEEEMLPNSPLNFEVAELYFLAGDNENSKRALEKYLANNSNTNEHDLLYAAIIYFKLGFFEKSINLLKIAEDSGLNTHFAQAAIYSEIGNISQAKIAFLRGVSNSEDKPFDSVIMISVVPDEWLVRDLKSHKEIVLELVKTGSPHDLELAFSHYLDQSDSNPEFMNLVFWIVEITGSSDLYKTLVKHFDKAKQMRNADFLLLQASNSLKAGHEIEAAILIEDLSKNSREEILVNILKARLNLRQSVAGEASTEISQLYSILLDRKGAGESSSIFDIKEVRSHLYLIDALIEINESTKAYDLLKEVIANVGLTQRASDLYPKVLKSVLEGNQTDKKLFIKNHSYRFTQEDQDLFYRFIKERQNLYPSKMQIDDDSFRAEHILDMLNELLTGKISNQQNTFQSSDSESSQSFIAPLNIKENEKIQNKFVSVVGEIENNPESAIKDLKIYLKEEPNSPRYLFALGLAYKVNGNDSDSYTAINLATEIWPDEYEWHHIAADLCEKLGDRLGAERHRNLAKNYNSPESNQANGITEKNIHQLILDFIYKNSEIPVRFFSVLPDYVEKYLLWGNFAAAKKISGLLLDAVPDKVDNRVRYCQILIAEGDYVGAEGTLDLILEEAPDNIDAIRLRIFLFIQRNQIRYASDLLAAAMQNKKVEGDSFAISKACIIEKEKSVIEAVEYLADQAGRTEDSKVLQQIAEYMLGQGALNFAETCINILLKMDASDGDTLRLAARLAEQQGDLDKATELFYRVISENPFDDDTYIHLAGLFKTKRQCDAGLKILEEGITFNPFSYPLLKMAGELLLDLKKSEEAGVLLRRAYTISKHDELLRSMLEKNGWLEDEEIEE